jgi:hypothetical protein
VTGPNPEKDSVRLKIEFLKNEAITYPIVYPKIESIKKIILSNPPALRPVCFLFILYGRLSNFYDFFFNKDQRTNRDGKAESTGYNPKDCE